MKGFLALGDLGVLGDLGALGILGVPELLSCLSFCFLTFLFVCVPTFFVVAIPFLCSTNESIKSSSKHQILLNLGSGNTSEINFLLRKHFFINHLFKNFARNRSLAKQIILTSFMTSTDRTPYNLTRF